MIRGKSVCVSGKLVSKTGCYSLEIVYLYDHLVLLLVDVMELEFPHYLNKRVWVAETDESWCVQVDLPRVAEVPFPPHILLFLASKFFFRTLLVVLGTHVDCCACANSS